MALPLAVGRSLIAPKGARRTRYLCALVIAIAIPFTVSRSGVLAFLTSGLVLSVTWPIRRIGKAIAIVGGVVALLAVAEPKLSNAILDLLVGVGNDDSVLSRTKASNVAFTMIDKSPIIGRGFGTFLPKNYVILDDQWLLLGVELGIVGVMLYALLCLAGFRAARLASVSADPVAKELGAGLSASIAAGAVAFATFDAFSFPMAAGTAFLLVALSISLHESLGLPDLNSC
jgi:O-antigen ligase